MSVFWKPWLCWHLISSAWRHAVPNDSSACWLYYYLPVLGKSSKLSLESSFLFIFIWASEWGGVEDRLLKCRHFSSPQFVAGWNFFSFYFSKSLFRHFLELVSERVWKTKLPRRFVHSHTWEELGLRASLASSTPPSSFVSYFPVKIWTPVWPVSWTVEISILWNKFSESYRWLLPYPYSAFQTWFPTLFSLKENALGQILAIYLL